MKRTVFEGYVNGEKFDNVAAYNARVNELMTAGTFVEASSNTRTEEIDINHNVNNTKPLETNYVTTSTADVVDEDLSFYPYMENEPFYLDLLVTNDADTNAEALKEARRVLDKCYGYICEHLHDDNIRTCTKKNYLSDVKAIINDLKADNQSNLDALAKIKERRAAIDDELAALDSEESLLRDAKPVIDTFIEFYRCIESETMQVIAEQDAKPRCTCNCVSEPVETTLSEEQPQTIFDFNDLIDRIFNGGRRLN